MFYTACWQLVFIHNRLFVINLALFSCHYQSAPTYPQRTNLFCFFERGQPKTDLKGGSLGWKGGSSFASLWLEPWLVWACKCAYACGMTKNYISF